MLFRNNAVENIWGSSQLCWVEKWSGIYKMKWSEVYILFLPFLSEICAHDYDILTSDQKLVAL